jgi:hypothetical protein
MAALVTAIYSPLHPVHCYFNPDKDELVLSLNRKPPLLAEVNI